VALVFGCIDSISSFLWILFYFGLHGNEKKKQHKHQYSVITLRVYNEPDRYSREMERIPMVNNTTTIITPVLIIIITTTAMIKTKKKTKT